DLYTETHSETETVSTTPSASNQNDSFIAYCKVCKISLAGTRQTPYPYLRKGGNTTNLINHLRDKHGITKENHKEFLDEHNEPQRDQTKITEYAKTPLYILQNASFRELILTCKPGYKIPCDKSVKAIIYDSFLWNFVFHEALLSCNYLPYPHSGEAISAELFQVINNWNLSNIVLTIVTDNGANMLSVLQGLKQCKQVHRRVKHLQAFFRLPKQAQRLREAQKNSEDLLENSYHNPLDVLTDVKTRWNSVYYVWKRVLELHNSMRSISTTLLEKSDQKSQQEGKKLERLCLSFDERQITRRICGAKYCTLSLVHSYIELLKKSFEPNSEKGETYDTYLDLIYGPQIESNNEVIEESDSSTSEDNGIPSGDSFEKNVDDFNHVEYLLAANTVGLLQKVRAAIFLSLEELWSRQSDLWDNTGKEKDESRKLLQIQYDLAKEDFYARNVYSQPIQQTTSMYDCADNDNNFFKALEHKELDNPYKSQEKKKKTRISERNKYIRQLEQRSNIILVSLTLDKLDKVQGVIVDVNSSSQYDSDTNEKTNVENKPVGPEKSTKKTWKMLKKRFKPGRVEDDEIDRTNKVKGEEDRRMLVGEDDKDDERKDNRSERPLQEKELSYHPHIAFKSLAQAQPHLEYGIKMELDKSKAPVIYQKVAESDKRIEDLSEPNDEATGDKIEREDRAKKVSQKSACDEEHNQRSGANP
ncbi:6391_t:CDS:10, partial [Gigaspora margarita]